MTCIRYASYVPETAPAPWLHLASPPGPRSPRIRSRSEGLCGPVISTETSWIDAGLPGMEIRQWFHEQHLLALRDALIDTTAKLRREHRASCLAMAQLRAVTNECLAMGER